MISVFKNKLPFCFVSNNSHYACYGTFYMNWIKRLEEIHLGAKNEMEEYGLSECRNDFSMSQAVYLAGVQTFMKSAKKQVVII